VSFELQKYIEPLEIDELMFLERKETSERRQYYKVYQLLMFLSFIIPFIGSWYRAAEGAPNAFSTLTFFVSAGILLFISTFATYMSYYVYLRKVQLDIRYKTKTIEINRIVRKLHVTTKSAYYFYIDSTIKLSIEVACSDYDRLKVGDEVSIEYASHSKFYLGYF
jgi:uncharacterized membrane protein